MITKSEFLPDCRQCPSNDFDLRHIKSSRYMVICHGTECVLEPEFPDVKSQFLSKATLQTAQFEPPENCPHIIKARKEGILPWAVGTIDFLNK